MRYTQRLVLLSTGMASVLFYLLHIIIGGLLWNGYSHLHQPISDLTASGAPNLLLIKSLTITYSIFAIIFSISFTVLESKKHRKLVIWGGIFLILLHLISLSYGLFPEDMPDQPLTFTGRMHIIVTALIVPFTIMAPFFIGFGLRKEKLWHSFAHYSILTGILICIFGTATGMFYAKGLPYFGLVERLNIGVLQLWMFIFSFQMIKKG